MKQALLAILLVIITHVSLAQIVQCGDGSYTTKYPAGPVTSFPTKVRGACGQPMWSTPCLLDYKQNLLGHYHPPVVDRFYFPVKPKVISGFSKVPQTNDWWTPYIWNWQTNKESNPTTNPYDTSYAGLDMDAVTKSFLAAYGLKVHPQPLVIRNHAWGFGIGAYGSASTSFPTLTTPTVIYNNNITWNVSIGGIVTPNDINNMTTISKQMWVDETDGTKVEDYGDWTVKVLWDDKKGNGLEMISGHGMPFIQCKRIGSGMVNMSITGNPPVVWAQTANSIGITVDNDGGGPNPPQHWGIFFPTGTAIDGRLDMNPPTYFNLTFDKEVYYQFGAIKYPSLLDSCSPLPAFRLNLPTGAD